MSLSRFYFSTLIQIHISWRRFRSGSKSGPMKWIQVDPYPQHCKLLQLIWFLFLIHRIRNDHVLLHIIFTFTYALFPFLLKIFHSFLVLGRKNHYSCWQENLPAFLTIDMDPMLSLSLGSSLFHFTWILIIFVVWFYYSIIFSYMDSKNPHNQGSYNLQKRQEEESQQART